MAATESPNNANNEVASHTKPPRKKASKWHLLWKIPLTMLGLLVVLVVCCRLFIFTDNFIRLKGQDFLTDLLGTEVVIGGLDISIPTTITISNLEIAPPADFKQKPLKIGRINLDLTFSKLLDRQLIVEEIAIDDLAAVLEGNTDDQYAIDTILAKFQGDGSTEPEPPPEDSGPFALPELPDLPVDIYVKEIRLGNWSATMDTKDISAAISPLTIKLQAALIHGQTTAAILVNIGESTEKPAQVTFEMRENGQPTTAGSASLYLGLKTDSASLASHQLHLDVEIVPDLTAPMTLKTAPLRFNLAANADLNKQEAVVSQLSLSMAEETLLDIQLAASKYFANPEAEIKRFSIHLPITDLAPLATAFMPGLKGNGTIDITLDPLTFALTDLQDPRHLDLNLAVNANKVGVTLPDMGLRLANLNLQLGLGIQRQLSDLLLNLALSASTVTYQNIDLGQADLGMNLYVPLAPAFAVLPNIVSGIKEMMPFKDNYELLTGGQNEKLKFDLRVGLNSVKMDNITAEAISTNINLNLPFGDLVRQEQKTPDTQLKLAVKVKGASTGAQNVEDIDLQIAAKAAPSILAGAISDFLPAFWGGSLPQWPAKLNALRLQLGLDVGKATHEDMVAAKRLHLGIKAESLDYLANKATLEMEMNSPELRYNSADTGVITMPLTLALAARRLGPDSVDIQKFAMDINRLITLDISGQAANVLSNTPQLKGLNIALRSESLENIWAFLPPAVKSDMQDWKVAGQLDLTLAADGKFPFPTLTRLGKASGQLNAGLPNLQPMFNYVDRGLPFSAAITMALNDFNFSMPGIDLTKANVIIGLSTGEENKHPAVTTDVAFQKLVMADPQLTIDNSKLSLILKQKLNDIKVNLAFNAADIAYPDMLNNPLHEADLQLSVAWLYGGDVSMEILLGAPSIGVGLNSNFNIVKPHLAFFEKAWEKPGLPGIDVTGQIALKLQQDQPTTIMPDSFTSSGGANFDVGLNLRQGIADLVLQGDFNDFNFTLDEETSLRSLSGHLPIVLKLFFDEGDNRLVLVKDVPVGSGLVALGLSNDNVLKQGNRPLYYELLRPYRLRSGLSILEVHAAGLTISDLALDLVINDGILAIDHLALNTIGGDIKGSMAAQLTASKALRWNLGLNFTGIDASTMLNIPSGPDSEINGNINLSLEKSELTRNINAAINVTKIGRSTLDRFLQTLDPEEKDPSILSTRRSLKLVSIKGLNIWIKYENLKLYLHYQTKIGIPGTPIAYNPIKPEILGEPYSLSEYLDALVDPLFQEYLGPILGWQTATTKESK